MPLPIAWAKLLRGRSAEPTQQLLALLRFGQLDLHGSGMCLL